LGGNVLESNEEKRDMEKQKRSDPMWKKIIDIGVQIEGKQFIWGLDDTDL
jgi:hypothetical protein